MMTDTRSTDSRSGELIGSEAVKEGFLEREVLGSAEEGSAMLFLPLWALTPFTMTSPPEQILYLGNSS